MPSFFWAPSIINAEFYEPPSNKCHLAYGIAFIKNIPATVTCGEIHEN